MGYPFFGSTNLRYGLKMINHERFVGEKLNERFHLLAYGGATAAGALFEAEENQQPDPSQRFAYLAADYNPDAASCSVEVLSCQDVHAATRHLAHYRKLCHPNLLEIRQIEGVCGHAALVALISPP